MGYYINNFRYADDTILVNDSVEKLQHQLIIVVNENNGKGLCINIKKMECKIMSKKKATANCKIYSHGKGISQM